MDTSRTVVLIDDDLEIRKRISKLIRVTFPSVTVKEFQEAKRALRYIEEALPDLILTDVIMPHMNGVTFLQTLKTHMNRYVKNIPVIVVTGVGNRELDRQARKMGAMDYITKPFHTKLFLMKLRRILKLSDAYPKKK